jgi:hypothetical protein
MSWFSKKVEEEKEMSDVSDIDESESEYDSSVENEHELKYDNQLEQIRQWNHIDHVDDINVFRIKVDELLKCNFERFEGQRATDPKHVIDLIDGFKLAPKAIYHNFILLHCPKLKSITVMDGSHRIAALKQISSNQREQISCYVHIHNTNMTDKECLQELFYRINFIKGTTASERQTQKESLDISSDLQDLFGSYRKNFPYIVPGKEQSTLNYYNKWRIGSLSLKNTLEEYKDKIKGLTSKEVYNKLMAINKKREQKGDIFFNHLNKKISEKTKEQCKDNHFYIGIDFPNVFKEL